MGNRHARAGGVDEGETLVQAVRRDEDAHVAGGLLGAAAAEDDEVAFLVILDAALDLPAVLGLVGGGAGELVARFVEDVAGEARAVETLRAVAGVFVGLAEVLAGLLDDVVGDLAGVLLRCVGMLLRDRPEGGRKAKRAGKQQSDQFRHTLQR